MRPPRLCSKCGKPYYRSNRVRVWTTTNFGHRYGWVKADEPVCCRCLPGTEATIIMREINPRWRPLKPVEKVAAANTPKNTETTKKKVKG